MKLFFIHAHDENGEDHDAFVRGDDRGSAVAAWINYYDIHNDCLPGFDVAVYEVPAVAGSAGVVGWDIIPVVN